ncbi:MAG: hypothetical protein SVW57_07680 [Thermodesulfobacteriota bacterium]|nr:hypothetical protein [Thermodesulfobacteriota bacterium]
MIVGRSIKLGLAYQDGLGIKRNLRKAIHYYMFSASQGYDSVQLNLSIIYANLPGKRRDLTEAVAEINKMEG